MLRNWKLFGVTTLVVFALTPPAPAGDKDGPPPDDKIKILELKIDGLINGIKGSFADVKADATAIRDELKSLKTHADLRLQVAVSRLEGQIGQLKQELDSVKNGGIKSFYPPDSKDRWAELRAEILAELRREMIVAKSSPIVTTTTTLGELMVVNRYPEEILLLINGVDQGRIRPNTTITVKALPAGAITYEIISPTWGSLGIRNRIIVSGETLRVNVQ